MALASANWIGENTTTVGAGPLALSGAISTFVPFSVLPDGSEVYYTLQEGFNRETGIGTVSNGTLTRNVQATLVAGVYTETTQPIDLVGNGTVFAVINSDFMTRIYNFSLDVQTSVDAAAASAQAAADSASIASDHETAAGQSAEDASSSELAANTSANNAANSATASSDSAAAALASQNAAKTSETNAKASETNSKTSETNAKASETAANNFAQSAVSAATNSANSATAALASQNAAKTSETNSKTSETNAANSAADALASKNAAKTSETNAKASETNSKASETDAEAAAAAAANSAALAQQYQPNTALQVMPGFVNATAGNTMNDNLADGIYQVTADSTGVPLAVTGKVWITHRGTTAIQQSWESQAAAGNANYGRKFFRTGVVDSGTVTWGAWEEWASMPGGALPSYTSNITGPMFIGADAAADQSTSHRPVNNEVFGCVAIPRGARPAQFGVSGRGAGATFWYRGYDTAASTLSEWKQLADKSSLGEAALLDVGTTSGTVAAGDDSRINGALQKSGGVMTGGIAMGANTITNSGQINFNGPTSARQTLLNMGVTGGVSRLVIPISTSQAVMILSGTSVLTFNSSGETTLSFQNAFTIVNAFVCSNGDANVPGDGYVDSLDSWNLTTGGTNLRNRRITGGGTVIWVSGSYRVNWVATGLVNI